MSKPSAPGTLTLHQWPKDEDHDLRMAVIAALLVWTVYFGSVYKYRTGRVGKTTPECVRAQVKGTGIKGFDVDLRPDQLDANWTQDLKRWFEVSDIEQGNKQIVSTVSSTPDENFGTKTKRDVLALCPEPWFQSRLIGCEQFASYTLLALSVGILLSRRSRVRRELEVLRIKQPGIQNLEVTPDEAEPLADGTDQAKLFSGDSAISFIGRGVFSTFHRSWDVHAAVVVGEDRIAQVERYFDTSLSYVTFSLAAMPTIGFEGTVRGLADALAYANSPANLPEVVAGLSIAFNSTFVALMIWLLLRILQDMYFRRVDTLTARLHAIVASVTESLQLDFSDRKTVQKFIEAISAQAVALKDAEANLTASEANITAAQEQHNQAAVKHQQVRQSTGMILKAADLATRPSAPEAVASQDENPVAS